MWRAAARALDRDHWWLRSMPTVLRGYPQITVRDYWDLTVAEHAFLLADLFDDEVTDG